MKRLSLLILIGLSSAFIYAQNIKTKSFSNTPVKKVLQYIEKEFDISFSYDSRLIENKSISLTTGVTLIENLRTLEDKTGFRFKKISDTNIVIKKNIEQSVSICGFTKEKNSKIAIQDVAIFNQKKNIYSTTNAKGYFELYNLDISDTLTVKLLGYETIKLPVKSLDKKDCETLFLVTGFESLNEVILNNYISSGFTKYKDGSIKATVNKINTLPRR